VSSKPGSENCALSCAGLPSRAGFGVVTTPNTDGATLLMSSVAEASAASGKISVSSHLKSTIRVYELLKNVLG